MMAFASLDISSNGLNYKTYKNKPEVRAYHQLVSLSKQSNCLCRNYIRMKLDTFYLSNALILSQ